MSRAYILVLHGLVAATVLMGLFRTCTVLVQIQMCSKYKISNTEERCNTAQYFFFFFTDYMLKKHFDISGCLKCASKINFTCF